MNTSIQGIKAAALIISFLLATLALLAFAGCTHLDKYDRSYSVSYSDAGGRTMSGAVTLRPTAGLAK